MIGSNRNNLFYIAFKIKGKDRSLFPEDIGNNVVFNAQGDLIDVMKADEGISQKYREILKPIWQREDGLCRHLCEYVAVRNLLANKETFSEVFINNYYFGEEIDKDSKKSLELLANDLIDRVGNGEVDAYHTRKCSTLGDKREQTMEEITFLLNVKECLRGYSRLPSLMEIKTVLKDQRILTKEDLRLARIDNNEYVRLSFTSEQQLGSHVVLMRKNGDNDFALYDPNFGAVFGLTKEQLCKTVTQLFYGYAKTEKLESSILRPIKFALPALAVSAAVAAYYGYSKISAALVGACIIDSVVPFYLSQHLEVKRPYYDTIGAVTSCHMRLHNDQLQKMSEELDGISAELDKHPDKQNGKLKELRVDDQRALGIVNFHNQTRSP